MLENGKRVEAEGEEVSLRRRTPIQRSRAIRANKNLRASEREQARAWRDAVMRSTGGLSIISGLPAEEAHHVIPKGVLRRRGLSAHVWDARNGVPLTRREHERHTTRVEPLLLSILPAAAFDFATQHGLEWHVKKHYPTAEVTE